MYNVARSLIMEALDVGPTWMKSMFSKVLNPIFDALMMSSRLKLGVGLLALGALSNNAGLRLEGRLELLTASLYFVRMMGGIPQWLMMIVMVVLSMFLPMLAIVIVAVATIAAALLMKWQLPKLEKDPDAMVRHLFMLRKYGLVDEETSELLDLYAGRLGRPDLQDDTNFYGHVGGYEYETVELHETIASIRDILNDHDTGLQEDFVPGDVIAPPAIQRGVDTRVLRTLALSAVTTIVLVRLI